MSRARSADVAALPVLHADRFSRARTVDDDRVGHAGRVTLHQGVAANLRIATRAPSRAARLRSCATGAPLRNVETQPFEVGNARHQQAFGLDDAARIKDGPRRLRPTPWGSPSYSRSGSLLGRLLRSRQRSSLKSSVSSRGEEHPGQAGPPRAPDRDGEISRYAPSPSRRIATGPPAIRFLRTFAPEFLS
jgi:hypothetical protein